MLTTRNGRERKRTAGRIGFLARRSTNQKATKPGSSRATRPASADSAAAVLVRQRGQGVGERAERDRGESGARPVERPGRVLVAALGDVGERQPQRDGRERQVDQEGDAPAQRVDQKAAERRPERRGDRGGGGPDADRAAAHLAREGRGDDGEALRHEQRGADALHGARRDQDEATRWRSRRRARRRRRWRCR